MSLVTGSKPGQVRALCAALVWLLRMIARNDAKTVSPCTAGNKD